MEDLKKIKIFLVDDDSMFTETLRHLLMEERTEIRTFSTGEECLGKLEEDPKIVVVDYYLNSDLHSQSALNGMQVLNKIKQSRPDTKVIMVSAQHNVDIALDTIKYGAYDYISKERNSLLKVKSDVKHICDSVEQETDDKKETQRLKKINIAIVAIIVIIYIINRLMIKGG